MAVFTGSLPNPSFFPATLIANSSPIFFISTGASVTGLNSSYPAIHVSRMSSGSVCSNPLSITIQVTSENNVRVTFSQAVMNNFALINPLNYIFTPYLSVCSCTPNDPSFPTYVDLEVHGMTTQSYSLNILTIEAV